MDNTIKDKEDYGIKVAMFIEEPKYMGEITEEEAKELNATVYSYTYGDDAIGYKLTLHWAVNTHEDTIVLAKYTYEGAVLSGVAVNHMLSLISTNKTMPDINAITYQGLERFLRDNPNVEALPLDESYAITFALDAAKLAVKQYINASLDHNEKTLLSTDSPMSIASIQETISTHNIETLETLANYTKAGLTDSSSHEKLLELIEENKQLVTAKQEADDALTEVPFKDLSPEHRVIAVDMAIDNTVREFLVMDGGDIDILSVKENGEMYEVYISYLGACSSCSSSGTGTLYAIENALKDKLDPHIRVIPI
ncbi:MAG: NifU family protein [Campylobacterota bacterium]|nr:NifU family protein [Campylobacterota bacterium]